jgi:MFS family permease
MQPTLGSIFAMAGALVTAMVIFMLVQGLNSVIFPPPEGTNLRDPEAMRTFVQSLPPLAFLVVLLSYALGSFAAGWIGARYAPRGAMSHALVIGAVLTAVGVMNLLAIPHPVWFAFLNVPEFILFAWLGGKVAMGTKPTQPVPA